MTLHHTLLSTLVSLMTVSCQIHTHWYVPGTPTVISSGAGAYLRDFRERVEADEEGLVVLRDSTSEGIYSAIPANSSHILPNTTTRYLAAYLCDYPEEDVLEEPLPRVFRAGGPVVVPCTVVGSPAPTIWWQKQAPGSGSTTPIFSNLTRPLLSPHNHLIIQNSTLQHSGTYRCVGRNVCGARCPGDDVTCNTGTLTPGTPVTITVSPGHGYHGYTNKAYLLYNKQDHFITLTGDNCFLEAEQCLNVVQYWKPGRPIASDVIFIGNRNLTTFTPTASGLPVNDGGICMFECYPPSHEGDGGLVSQVGCGEDQIDVNCLTQNTLTQRLLSTVNVAIKPVPDFQIENEHQSVKFNESRTHLNFYIHRTGSFLFYLLDDITCYHNNKKIENSDHVQVSEGTSPRESNKISWTIQMDCPMRADAGYYYCVLTDAGGGMSVSPYTSVIDVSRHDCRLIRVLEKSRDTLTVTWSPHHFGNHGNKTLHVHPAPCYQGNTVCSTPTQSYKILGNMTVVIVTDLIAGCCYDIALYQADSRMIIAESHNTRSFKPEGSLPKALSTEGMRYEAYYHNNDKLRITWQALERVWWGDDVIHYVITRHGNTYNVSRDTFLAVNELVAPAQGTNFGDMTMRLCNSVGCTVPHHIILDIPPRSNMPRLHFTEVGCRKVKLNLRTEDTSTYFKYRYDLIRLTDDAESIFNGNLTPGETTIKYVETGTRYNLMIWGVNRNDSMTPLQVVQFGTKSFCEREVTIVSISAFIFLTVALMVLVHLTRRLRGRKRESNYIYEMKDDQSVFSQEDSISIVHINHELSIPPTKTKPRNKLFKTFKISFRNIR